MPENQLLRNLLLEGTRRRHDRENDEATKSQYGQDWVWKMQWMWHKIENMYKIHI